jgi:hypothetical protein
VCQRARIGEGRARRTGSAAGGRIEHVERRRELECVWGWQDGVAAAAPDSNESGQSSGARVVERRPGELGAVREVWWIWGFRVQFGRRRGL